MKDDPSLTHKPTDRALADRMKLLAGWQALRYLDMARVDTLAILYLRIGSGYSEDVGGWHPPGIVDQMRRHYAEYGVVTTPETDAQRAVRRTTHTFLPSATVVQARENAYAALHRAQSLLQKIESTMRDRGFSADTVFSKVEGVRAGRSITFEQLEDGLARLSLTPQQSDALLIMHTAGYISAVNRLTYNLIYMLEHNNGDLPGRYPMVRSGIVYLPNPTLAMEVEDLYGEGSPFEEGVREHSLAEELASRTSATLSSSAGVLSSPTSAPSAMFALARSLSPVPALSAAFAPDSPTHAAVPASAMCCMQCGTCDVNTLAICRTCNVTICKACYFTHRHVVLTKASPYVSPPEQAPAAPPPTHSTVPAAAVCCVRCKLCDVNALAVCRLCQAVLCARCYYPHVRQIHPSLR